MKSLLLTFPTFFFLVVGCSFLDPTSSIEYKEVRAINKELKKINTLYIRKFEGTNSAKHKEILIENIKDLDKYDVVDILPDELKGVGIIDVTTEEFNSWENEEEIPQLDPLAVIDGKETGTLFRRNVQVAFKLNLTNALTDEIVASKTQYQSYQQVFPSQEVLNESKGINEELNRVSKRALADLAEYLSYESRTRRLRLEEGENPETFSFFLFHESYLEKGIRFTHAGRFEQAVTLWKIVIFEPVANEKEDLKGLYYKNKASAFYNIGQIRFKQARWKEAASMFSRANRLVQKVRYAQAWADSIQKWIDEWRLLKEKENAYQPLPEKDLIEEIDIETVEELLLDERKLWPFVNFEEIEEVEKKKKEIEEKEQELYEDGVGEPLIQGSPDYDLSPLDLD